MTGEDPTTALARVDAAIAKIEAGLQEYSFAERTAKRPALRDLYDRRADLVRQIERAAGTSSRGRVAVFGGF